MKKHLILAALCFMGLTASAQSVTTFTHPWQGKKVGYIGDSITDPKNNAGKKKYWLWLQEWLGITPYVYGVSGRQWNDVCRQATKLKEEHGDDVDAIFVFMGTNDWNNAVPMGEWYAEKDSMVEFAHGGSTKQLVQRRHRELVKGNDSFKGRINLALDSLKRLYPHKQIVLLTPIHRARFYANEKNWQPTEDWSNALGLFIDDYVQAVKEAGNVWAVPVIDWNSTSGLYPMHENEDYFGHENDRLHPNDKGQERMARTLMYQLLALPCQF